jgi:hypothetical protein
MIKFSEDMLIDLNISEELKSLSEVDTFVRFDISYPRFSIKNYGYNADAVAMQLKDNSGDITNRRDVYFACIVSMLAHTDMIPADKGDLATVFDKNISAKISDLALSNGKRMTNLVLKVALHAFCHDISDGRLKCYDAFTKVSGNFISETRLVNICREIHAAGSVGKIMDMLTLRDINAENNVFSYMLVRLSSPALVKKALQLMPHKAIYGYFDPAAVRAYRNFDQAGLAAQIAAGPLRVYCKGNINPLTIANYSDDIKLSQLAPIYKAPYHEPTLRLVKIIPDEYGIQYGRWYQGARAAAIQSPTDNRFRALVKKIREVA